jgi:hypothetical protein
MKYPTLTELTTSREMIDVFGGYNHNLRIGVGEFYDMTNLTSADYPVLSPRPKRGIYASPDNPQGLISKDALCYVDGEDFVINDYRVPVGLSTKAEDCPKTLISMGAYVIIMPDKKYVDTANFASQSQFSIEASVTTASTVTFSLCKLDGSEYENTVVSDTAPESPKNLDLWIDTSSTPHALKQYAETTALWTSVATTYIKISATGIGKPFSEGDGVTISGIDTDELLDLNSTMVIQAKGENFIVVTGILDAVSTTDAKVTVARRMPNMDFVIESNNRLWGCRYGVALNGEVVNEIYASKQGDFKNWNCFAGISTDSYVASVGTDGQFTGAITHLGYPLFFKENYVHKVYGYYPANYQIQTTACRGVQKGCHKSLAILNETLYYKSQSAVCAFDGSLPVEMSSALGDVAYGDAVAGVLGNKYYISMESNGEYHLFVYDASKGMWHREDNTRAVDFCNSRGNLYFIDYSDKQIKSVTGTGALEESAIKWSAVTGVIGTGTPDKKYVSRLVVRLSLEVGSSVTFSAEYDSSGEWEHLFTKSGTKLGSFSIPLRMKRCDHLRLRITGTGEAKIYSIAKTIEQGSDI